VFQPQVRVTSLLRFLAASLVIQWTLLGALRVVFWWVFRDPLDPIPTDSIAKAFYLGAKFDLRLCLLLHVPIALAGIVPRWNPGRHPRPRNWAIGYLAAAAAGLLLVHGFDGGHYEYLASRLDASSLRFLHNPYESLGVLWESYPVLLGSLAVIAVGATYGWLLRSTLPLSSGPRRGGRAQLAAAIATVLLFAGGIYGKLSYYPLRWSDAFFSTHEFASSLALNPTLYFLDTFKNRSVEYDADAARSHYPHISRYLGVPDPDAETLQYARALSPATNRNARPNVVIVLLESLAYYKTGFSGNALDPSPHLDRIAREGRLYTRFYAPHGGTARAVFAAFTGLPDVEPSKTSTRNPLIVEQHTLFNAFANYEKFYFLEGDYTSPRVDVWGISDLHLFEEANRVLREVDEPFIAFIHTAGNHKPFSIPEDSRGFEPSTLSDEAVIPHGFDTVAELDGMRLMDHSLGWFFETARREAYFDNTIFALFGDHGSPAPTLHRPPGEDQLRLSRYHVPLIVYGPGFIPTGESDVIGSTVDILPTLVELAGAEGTATTLGRSLARPDDEPRFAFTITGQGHLPRLGLVGEEHYFTVYENGSDPLLHRIYADDPRKDLSDDEPDRAAEFLRHTLATYETVKYMRYHNAARDQSESSPTTASGSE
jgi:hypothetical protein